MTPLVATARRPKRPLRGQFDKKNLEIYMPTCIRLSRRGTASDFRTLVQGKHLANKVVHIYSDWATICWRKYDDNAKPVRCYTGTLQTERRADGQHCYIDFVSVQTRDETAAHRSFC